MSYAAVAAKGPKQSPEEARAPPPPELEHTTDESTSSLVDVDSESVRTVPSDYQEQTIKTDTQAERIQREEEDKQLAAERAKAEFEEKERAAKQEFEKKKQQAKSKAGKARENSDNPVVLGNAVAVVALSAALGFGAYRKYAAGELTWKVAGMWAGVVGLFAAGDYYLSQYLFKNKYPPK